MIEVVFRGGQLVRLLNGKPITEERARALMGTKPPNYEAGECPATKPPPDMGWEGENGGRGRYISQLQREPGKEGCDPEAFCRSRNEIEEKAKRRGMKVLTK
jgi:hypothetical protein